MGDFMNRDIICGSVPVCRNSFLCRFLFLLSFLFCMFFFMPLSVFAVHISEVYYDPVDSERGGEAVELFNPSSSDVDIGGWVLKTKISATDAVVPPNTLIPAYSFYLIADAGWSDMRDDPSWPEADIEDAMTLSNSNGGVALVDSSGNIVSAVGWGDPSFIPSDIFEGFPASQVNEGFSLKRISDTGDNSVDFVSSLPDLKNSSFFADDGIELVVEVTIPPCNVSLDSFSDDDPLVEGYQLLPFPGKPKIVPVVIFGDEGLTVSGFLENKSFAFMPEGSLYYGDLVMDYFDSPGLYSLNISAVSHSSACTIEVLFEYLSMSAISVDAEDIDFGRIVRGRKSQVLGDFDISSPSPTVRNIGNTPLDIGVYGSDLISSAGSVSVSNIVFSLDNIFGSSLSSVVTKDVVVMDVGILPSQSLPLGLQLSVPVDAPEGIYSGELFVSAVIVGGD